MRRFLIASALLTVSAAAWAQDPDPPSRVARLNYENGQVSFRPGSVEDWTAASLNYPLTTGDHLWTDAGAQAEMHVGSTAIRMDSQTALEILNLDDSIVQLSLTQGSLNVHMPYLGEGEAFEVDTPNVAVSLLRPGDYRIDADGDNAVTAITIRGGEAEATGGGAAFSVHPQESARVAGMDTVTQEVGPALPINEFEQWCAARDRREAGSVSARYVPRETIGYEDLDQYGVWTEMPPYGPVWRPRAIAIGWAPYRYGHWAWVEPWGWTWIDDAPWGFAPFHYGRWAFTAGAWYWAPGRMVVGVRPVYAPALVAFVGGGAGMAAWFPLGPGEVYRPAYHVSQVYVRNINIVHVRDVNVLNVRYVNQGIAGAVTVVPHDAFVSARPVAVAAVQVDAGVLAREQVVGYTAPVAPVRASVLAHAGRGVAPPPRFAGRTVVVRTAPPPPRVGFAAQQRYLTANQGRPLDPGQMSTLRQSVPARNPMVRSAGAPPRGPAGFRPAPAQRPMNAERPPSVVQPRNDRPAVNDRPSGAYQPRNERPAANDQPPGPYQPRIDRPMNTQRPPGAYQQPRGERPPTVQPQRPNSERPAATPPQRPTNERPAAAELPAPESRRQAPQERRGEKRNEKKNDRDEQRRQ